MPTETRIWMLMGLALFAVLGVNLSSLPESRSILYMLQDQFVRRVMLTRSTEKTSELEEEGGYYTPEEMKKILHYPQHPSCNPTLYVAFT